VLAAQRLVDEHTVGVASNGDELDRIENSQDPHIGPGRVGRHEPLQHRHEEVAEHGEDQEDPTILA
jgi:hypothetical protein